MEESKKTLGAPYDIAVTIADEMEKPFKGRTVHYIASDEVSPDEIAATLERSIGNPHLEWKVIQSKELLDQMLSAGINEWIAKKI
jgi:hypothetical protein